jgi:hypothetical protein
MNFWETADYFTFAMAASRYAASRSSSDIQVLRVMACVLTCSTIVQANRSLQLPFFPA